LNTRDKILITSIELFNEYGINNISTKTISEKANINSENLYYYFKKKQDILLAIFDMIVKDFNELYTLKEGNTPNEDYLEGILTMIVITQRKYVFFYRDMFIIFLEFPEFKEVYKTKLEERKILIKAILDSFVKSKYLKASIKKDYSDLIDIIWFNLSSLSLKLSFKSIIVDESYKKKIKKNIYILLSAYLSPLGKEKLFSEF